MATLRRSKRIQKIYRQVNGYSSESSEELYELESDDDDDSMGSFIVNSESDDGSEDYTDNTEIDESVTESSENSESESDNELKDKIKYKFKRSMNEVIKYIEEKYIQQKDDLSHLPEEERERIHKIEAEIEKINSSRVPNRVKILTSNLPIDLKAEIIQRIDQITSMDNTTTEYHKLKQWIEGFMTIPFGIYKDMEYDDIQTFLIQVRKTLDEAVFGHDEAKDDIIQLVAQWISNPSSIGQVLGISGHKGTGKTKLVKYGIAKALNRPFCFFSLGGATDGSILDGYSYTYEGATWGRLVDMLIKSKCMNPVIFFDELDKVSETKCGQEIIGKLIHLTDFTQNDSIQDKYFSGIPFDFSRALFIFSFNDETKIDKILMDRIKLIKTQDFSRLDKIQIAKNYIIPELNETIGIEANQIIISDEIYQYIMNKNPEEKGVRKFKELLRTLYMKINVNRYLTDVPYKIENFSLPIHVTKDIVDSLIKIPPTQQQMSMYI